MTTARWKLLALLSASLLPAAAVASQEKNPGEFEFLYINAGEHSASGGHAALRIGEEVFHFQHVEPDMIRATRDDFQHFRTTYNYTENRTIRALRIRAPKAAIEALRSGFTHRLLTQDEQFKVWEDLSKDITLLKTLLGLQASSERGALPIPGLGWFQVSSRAFRPVPGPVSIPGENPAIGRLRDGILARHGHDYLVGIYREVYGRLRQLGTKLPVSGPWPPEKGRFALAPYSFSERYLDHLSALAALQVLIAAAHPAPGAITHPQEREFRLSAAESEALARLRERLERSLAESIRPETPGWGYALLQGMLRLAALDRSLVTGRLAVPVQQGEPSTVADGPAAVEFSRAKFWASRGRYFQSKQALAGGESLDEAAYVRLEKATGQFLRTRRELSRNGTAEGQMTRSPAISVTPVPLTRSRAELLGELKSLENRAESYEQSLRGLYHYDLLKRNCVTELLQTMDETLRAVPANTGIVGNGLIAAETAGDSGLGELAASHFYDFIPFLAYRSMHKHGQVASLALYPSWRHTQLKDAQDRGEGQGVWTTLEESNVLTTRLQPWNPKDGAFLFFSEDAYWFRPLAGGANALVGLGQGLAGILTLPWDDGSNLYKGIKGMALSIPELFFFNIRKGSYPVPQTQAFD